MPYCLSLQSGVTRLSIAKINNKEDIYLHECDFESKPEISTTPGNKLLIFQSFLRREKKLLKKDFDLLSNYYTNGYQEIDTIPKLDKLYEQSLEYVTESLKRYMNFNDKTILSPVLPKRSIRAYCSGLSGSGKSFYISKLISENYAPETLIYLFSPVENDKAFERLNLFHIHLETFELDFGQPFDIDMLKRNDGEEGCIVLMDDVNTFTNPQIRKRYMDVQNALLERGRHLDIQLTITVSHNPLAGNFSKAPLREAEYYILFPSTNHRDSKVLLKTYTGLSQDEIDEILKLRTRGLIVKKSVPSYYVSDHNAAILGKM